MIRSWLRARLSMGDVHLEEIAAEVIANRDEALSVDDRLDAIMSSEHAPSINGFLRDPDTGELVLEGRCVKAGLKEWANSAYPGVDWPGKTAVSKGFRKGLMSTLAERVFVAERFIGLGVKEPDLVQERIKHVKTPQGPKSAVNRVELVDTPTLSFTLKVHDDFPPREAWGRMAARRRCRSRRRSRPRPQRRPVRSAALRANLNPRHRLGPTGPGRCPGTTYPANLMPVAKPTSPATPRPRHAIPHRPTGPSRTPAAPSPSCTDPTSPA